MEFNCFLLRFLSIFVWSFSVCCCCLRLIIFLLCFLILVVNELIFDCVNCCRRLSFVSVYFLSLSLFSWRLWSFCLMMWCVVIFFLSVVVYFFMSVLFMVCMVWGFDGVLCLFSAVSFFFVNRKWFIALSVCVVLFGVFCCDMFVLSLYFFCLLFFMFVLMMWLIFIIVILSLYVFNRRCFSVIS